MTIPDDVRDVIMDALSVMLGRQVREREPYERTMKAIAWLDAQPDAPQTMPEEERVTIPKDVRTAAYTLMQRHLTEPFANDEERWLVLRQADDACELLDAWLDTQSDAPEREAMTIPGDVRDIIQDALYEYKAIAMGIQDVTGESREDVLVAIDAACAWLKGQPSERWQPVGDGCHGMTESVLAWQDDDAGGLWRAVHVDDTGREETGKFYDWLSAFRWINERRTRDRSDAASIQDEPPHTQPETPAERDAVTDYDAMMARVRNGSAYTECEKMRLQALKTAYHLEDGLGPNGVLGPYNDEQAGLVRDLLDDLHAVADWLEDAQPIAPKRWELAKHGFRFSQTDEDGDITLIVVDNLLGYPPKLLISIHGVLGLVELPDNLRLFCCTEATG